MKLKFNGELSHKTSLEEERERIMIWICLLVCFSIYWDLLILFTIYNISCIYFLQFALQKEYDPNKKEFFFSVYHNLEKWLVKVLCMSFFVHFLFLLFLKHIWVRSGLFFFPGINVTCWYVEKQAVFWKWGAFKIFGSDKLIFKSTRKSYSVICCVLQGNSNTVMF